MPDAETYLSPENEHVAKFVVSKSHAYEYDRNDLKWQCSEELRALVRIFTMVASAKGEKFLCGT